MDQKYRLHFKASDWLDSFEMLETMQFIMRFIVFINIRLFLLPSVVTLDLSRSTWPMKRRLLQIYHRLRVGELQSRKWLSKFLSQQIFCSSEHASCFTVFVTVYQKVCRKCDSMCWTQECENLHLMPEIKSAN